MRHVLTASLAAALCLLSAGCGSKLLQTEGRVLKGGQPFIPKEGEALQILFVPILPDGQLPPDYYVAVVDQTTGTFRPAGKDTKGMPPGKYRVAVELMKSKKDVLKGAFNSEKSPFVFDVDANTKEIVIDLDNPPKG